MSFSKLPIIKSIINRFDQDLAEFGLQPTFARIIKNTHTKLIIRKPLGLDKVLADSPVILIANHPFEIEPVLIFASTPKRDDAFIIANHQFFNICPNLTQHIIPVFIKHNIERYCQNGFRNKLLNFISPHYCLNPHQSHLKNIKSLSLASKKISQGGLILIFPAKEDGSFYPGVGHIARKIKTQKPAYLVQAYISGTSKFDIFRLIPIFNRLFPSIIITYSQPMKINMLSKKDGKQIAQKLFKDYDKWVKSIKSV